MNEKVKTIYYCDFCSRRYLYKAVAAFHEQYCGRNPENQHKCLQACKHLRVTTFVLESDPNWIDHKDFYCKCLEQKLHSYKAEKIAARYAKGAMARTVTGTERMPLECTFYEFGELFDNQTVVLEEEFDYANW